MGQNRLSLRVWILLLCIGIPNFGSQARAEDSEFVRVGVYQNKPGVFVDAEGEIRGFYVDILKHVAQEEQWTIHFVPGTWDQNLQRLENGSIDLLTGIAYTKERDQIFDFTKQTVFPNWGQVYTLEEDADSVLWLKDRVIAGVKGDVYTHGLEKLLAEFDFPYDMLYTTSYEEVLSRVETGDADAGVIPRSSGMVIEHEYDVYKAPIVCCVVEVRYAVKAGTHAGLIAALDQQLKSLKGDKSSLYYSAMNHWYGGIEQEHFPKWLIWTLAVGAGVLVPMLIGNMVLRKQVKARTLALEKEISVRKHAEIALREAMHNLRTIQVAPGVIWMQIPEAGLYILCGCPGEVVKHLMHRGLIQRTTQNGVTWETGPNVILLSDLLIQNGGFANLAEFPVLQMLYRQGMILPKHPNNTGVKPLLIGRESQVRAQMHYIHRGNYGLLDKGELLVEGVDESTADMMMKIKIKFAFGAIREPSQIIDSLFIDTHPVEIRNGVTVARTALNTYRFSYRGNSQDVDLNLPAGTPYEPPYPLGQHRIPRYHEFAVLHTGQGDGWDRNRPSMSSVILFHGRIYLIDAGPGVLQVLTALGIDISEVNGIFHTHAHDDHFAGLPALIRSDRRMRYFAVPVVRASVVKKFAALMSLDEHQFHHFFAVRDLASGQWNDCDGLLVKPIFSPHPVENTVFMFKAGEGPEEKTYAHWADLSSFKVLDGMVGTEKHDLPLSLVENIKRSYLERANLKKLDIGGGMIHGMAEDFRSDPSDRLILAHIDRKLLPAEMEIGSEAAFGAVDVLIPGEKNLMTDRAFGFIKAFFPHIDEKEITLLVQQAPKVNYNAGTIIHRAQDSCDYLEMVLSGTVAYLESRNGVENHLSIGSFLGGIDFLGLKSEDSWTLRSISDCMVIRLSHANVLAFLEKNNLKRDFVESMRKIRFLRKTWLFGEATTSFTLNRIAHSLTPMMFEVGREMSISDQKSLWVVSGGQVALADEDGRIVDELGDGGVFGEQNFINPSLTGGFARALETTPLFRLDYDDLMNIPIVHWKMLELYDKRWRFKQR
ncbi:MAG: cyclic nucleotide-binding protein [Magnetococcales bacterium]|nr:cyclic nucleotide-binding protein [Magnetococcales bacterium]HIJ82590.1 transporter substrate-binding domain-containing protein [Magnetococcales bacterium]